MGVLICWERRGFVLLLLLLLRKHLELFFFAWTFCSGFQLKGVGYWSVRHDLSVGLLPLGFIVTRTG